MFSCTNRVSAKCNARKTSFTKQRAQNKVYTGRVRPPPKLRTVVLGFARVKWHVLKAGLDGVLDNFAGQIYWTNIFRRCAGTHQINLSSDSIQYSCTIQQSSGLPYIVHVLRPVQLLEHAE
ncbi:hypothetical protein RvY_15472 [Ramazzottius varieornatus]|uniref:Uncharacterized protein n=1 Tax=Ramazzottius varieornatus TaxID=947166 RepID=A0A1D1VV32_RAMVA|nr:hypothetical protein RvY_15472 [Ramazzottius varieornatus]